jgi:hypothetical protein
MLADGQPSGLIENGKTSPCIDYMVANPILAYTWAYTYSSHCRLFFSSFYSTPFFTPLTKSPPLLLLCVCTFDPSASNIASVRGGSTRAQWRWLMCVIALNFHEQMKGSSSSWVPTAEANLHIRGG